MSATCSGLSFSFVVTSLVDPETAIRITVVKETLFFLPALFATAALGDELPPDTDLVRTFYVLFLDGSQSIESTILVSVYQNDDSGFLALERRQSEGSATLETLAVLEIDKPRPDSWFTHFMDCRYADGHSSSGHLISEVRFSEVNAPRTVTNFHPANAWLIDASGLSISPEDPTKVNCRESLP